MVIHTLKQQLSFIFEFKASQKFILFENFPWTDFFCSKWRIFEFISWHEESWRLKDHVEATITFSGIEEEMVLSLNLSHRTLSLSLSNSHLHTRSLYLSLYFWQRANTHTQTHTHVHSLSLILTYTYTQTVSLSLSLYIYIYITNTHGLSLSLSYTYSPTPTQAQPILTSTYLLICWKLTGKKIFSMLDFSKSFTILLALLIRQFS